MTTPFKIKFRKKVKDIPNSEILNNFKVNFERTWCDKATIINDTKLIVENELIRIKPDLNWNLWVGIGKAEVIIKDGIENEDKEILYTVDFTRLSVTFVLSVAFIFSVIFFNINPAEYEYPIFRILIIILFSIGLFTHAIMIIRHLTIFLKTIKKGNSNIGNYNWKDILKEKTDKELYDISVGKTVLPDEISKLANNELRERHANFKDKDLNK